MLNNGRLLLLLIAFLSVPIRFFNAPVTKNHPPAKKELSQPNALAQYWVDSIYQQMNWEERIGQLFMARAHSDLPKSHIDEVKRIIKEHHVGGLCFFQGTPTKQAELTNAYQEISKVPLMIAVDAEWGIGMRFKESAISFPRQLTLGALQDNSLIYQMGREIAREMKAVGMHVNFAPVADINNNPNNPVINDRSFGEDRYNVAAKCFQYMKGLQDGGIMACAKHFPGHGDTDVDSHLDLPVITHDRQRLDSVELYPFKILIDQGVQSIMVAHLQVPAFDTAAHIPTTLSKKTITGVLRNELGFKGLTFTDALEMKGVTKHFGPGEVALRAFQAGNDMLVLPDNFVDAFKRMKKAIDDGEISEAQVEERVKRILQSKYDLGLHQYRPVAISRVVGQVFNESAQTLKYHLYEKSLTVASNEQNLIPIIDVSKQKFLSIAIGSNSETTFQKMLKNYLSGEYKSIGHDQFETRKNDFESAAKKADVVIVSLHNMNKSARLNFKLNNDAVRWINDISSKKKVILVVFGNPYSLANFESVGHVLQAYEDDDMMQNAAAQGLMGVTSMTGSLPVSAGSKYRFGEGHQTTSLKRLGYGTPESVGMNSDTLSKIDDMVREMIKNHAVPGCQILVAKDGRIVYEKAFGSHTYANQQPVELTDLYDLASVTKIAATTLSMMRLSGEGKVDVQHSMGYYLPMLEGTNKAKLRIDQVMAHQAGIKSWIPFYKSTMEGPERNPKPMQSVYHQTESIEFDIPIAKNMFMNHHYIDSIWYQIKESEVQPGGRYRYSDLGFYLLAQLIEEQTKQPIDKYTSATFYEPLGMKHTTYKPLLKFDKSNIVPSEEDHYFRMQRVQGYVHDMGCAMLGGVSGHAGLFSNAHDMAVLMQMLMNNGYYGGYRYLEEDVIKQFTRRYHGSTRRAIGFDMKDENESNKSYTSPLASNLTYGHTGFTGICVWNDPAYNLTYIFLSNRTYPSSFSNKLNKELYRERIHTLIYQSFLPRDKGATIP